MLSQSLVKSALALEVFPAPAERQQNLEELHATLLLWQRNQEGLQHGDCALGLPGNNSDVVTHLFAAIHPDYLAMVRAANELQRMLTSGTTVRAPDLLPDIRSIMSEQVKFLTGMDRVVTQYQREAEDHMSRLRLIEFTLLGLTLCVLLLEGLYIFRPTVLRLRQTILDLRMANERIVHAELTRKKAESLK